MTSSRVVSVLIPIGDEKDYFFRETSTDLSRATAARVLTLALTATPCTYGTALHRNHPNSHSEQTDDKHNGVDNNFGNNRMCNSEREKTDIRQCRQTARNDYRSARTVRGSAFQPPRSRNDHLENLRLIFHSTQGIQSE